MGARGRFILRYTGAGAAPAADVARLRAVPGTMVLDATSRMLLVEGSQQDLEGAASALGGWVVTAEQIVQLPDPRKKIEGGPA